MHAAAKRNMPVLVDRKGRRGEALRFYREVVLTYEGDACLPWPFCRDDKGYGILQENGAARRVSRLACRDTYGDPPTSEHVAAHNCGKGHEACCAKRHLRWATRSENEADRIIHGTTNRGEAAHLAKLTSRQVFAIRRLQGSMSHEKIGAQFGISQAQTSRILRGESWGWL